MDVILISSLLGVAALALQVSALEESLGINVSVRPPGPNIYLGECVFLQCKVESHSALVKSYRWYRSRPSTVPNPRHMVSGDSYFITAVTREDADRYWCQAECRKNRTVFVAKAQPVALNVSELTPPSLSLTPNTRQMLRGERFTVRCPTSETNSSGWKLVHFSPDWPVGTTVFTVHNSPPGGVSADKSEAFVFNAASGKSGLYWCEGSKGRSNAVNITVSYGNIILKSPAFPVFMGDEVVLYCQYETSNHNKATLLKNGAEMGTYSSSSSDGVIKMTIENVTQEDEGFYKCASQDGQMESPGSWLSVRPQRGSLTSPGEIPASTTSGSWKWIIVSCGAVLLFLIPLSVWLVCHYSCWPVSKRDVQAEALPATKQDVTEVQWDLSWMEMSNLLDKQLYPST